jgi:dihydrofolate reductase
MAKLNYVTVMSVDGYIGDGHYDWSRPVEGSTAFITEVIRPFGTYLYGRKNYETMSFWETPEVENMGADDQEFARVWRSAEKIVYSKTLSATNTQRTRIESDFNVQRIRELKDSSPKDLCIGGPTIAGLALRNGLLDEIHLFLVPATIGSRIPTIPALPREMAIHLELLEDRKFCKNWVYLRYRVLI